MKIVLLKTRASVSWDRTSRQQHQATTFCTSTVFRLMLALSRSFAQHGPSSSFNVGIASFIAQHTPHTHLVRGRLGFNTQSNHTKNLKKWYMLLPCLAFSTLGKSMGVKHTVLPDGQPPTVAFTVLAQLCDHRANKMVVMAALSIKNGEGRTFTLEFDTTALKTAFSFKPVNALSLYMWPFHRMLSPTFFWKQSWLFIENEKVLEEKCAQTLIFMDLNSRCIQKESLGRCFNRKNEIFLRRFNDENVF